MQINLSGHHVEITDAIRNYVNDKMAKVERHFDKVGTISVILTVESVRHKAEASVHMSGHDIFADATNEDENMYAAIDALVDKLDRQVKKHKEKITNHHNKNNHADFTVEETQAE